MLILRAYLAHSTMKVRPRSACNHKIRLLILSLRTVSAPNDRPRDQTRSEGNLTERSVAHSPEPVHSPFPGVSSYIAAVPRGSGRGREESNVRFPRFTYKQGTIKQPVTFFA